VEDAFVSADLSYFYQVLEGTNAGATGSGSVEFDAEAAPNDSGLWSLGFEIDVPAGTTKLRFAFDNRLTAQATTNLSSAFIAKKLIDGIKITIPEPSAAMLLLLGFFALAVGNRR
jgi:hypothetical protein